MNTIHQNCKTCGGSKVDPGGLPICRSCGPSSSIRNDAEFMRAFDDLFGETSPSRWHNARNDFINRIDARAASRNAGLLTEALAWIEHSSEPAPSLCSDLRAAIAHPTQPSSTPITAEGAVKILRGLVDTYCNNSVGENVYNRIMSAGKFLAAFDAEAAARKQGYLAPIKLAASLNSPGLWLDENGTYYELAYSLAPQDAKAEQADPIGEFQAEARQAKLNDMAQSWSKSAPIEAGELPPLPKAERELIELHQPAEYTTHVCTSARYTADQMLAYGKLCRDIKLDDGDSIYRTHVEDWATKAGWVNKAEGAFEFAQRTCYRQGWNDAVTQFNMKEGQQ